MTNGKNISLDDEIALLIEQCGKLAGLEEVDPDSAARLRALQQEEVRIRKALEAEHKKMKAPHLEAGKLVDAAYGPKIALVKSTIEPIAKLLTGYLQAIDRKLRADAAAKRAEEEDARRKAEEAAKTAETSADPFDVYEASEAARAAQKVRYEAREAAVQRPSVVGSDGGRAGGLKTTGWDVEVLDNSALVQHFFSHPSIIEAARQLALSYARATKGGVSPGCKVSPIQKAA